MFMKFLLFMVIALAVFWLVNQGLTKWLGKDERKLSDTEGRLLDRWGRGVLLLIFLVVLIKIRAIPEFDRAMSIYWLIFIILTFGFQSFMEWKYLKGSKEYLKTLIILCFSVAVLGLLYAFRFWLV
jgi:hypothetical protein